MNYREYMRRVESVGEVADLFVVGYSLLSQPSYEGRQAIIQCAIHAREYVTSLLGVELTKYYSTMPFGGGAYFVYDSNPDGVRLVLDGAEWIECEKQKEYLLAINGSEDFSTYKANANAVDLNTNFDAKWGGGAANLRCPSPANFIGYYPMSEREVRTLADFTERIRPYATISYHTKGEVIYYGFEGQKENSLIRDEAIAYRLSAVTGYTPILTANSTGGYKDWCIEKYDIPSFTIEVAPNEARHPIGVEYLPELFEQNKDVLFALLE